MKTTTLKNFVYLPCSASLSAVTPLAFALTIVLAASTAYGQLVAVDVLRVNNPAYFLDSFNIDEDSSVSIDVSSTVIDIEPEDILSLTVNGIDPGWDFSGSDWASTEAAGEYRTTLAAGIDVYSGGFTLAPPADSDVDLTNVQIDAIVTRGGIEQANAQDAFSVIVDAVADIPTLSVMAGDVDLNTYTVDVSINAAVTDTDGSESFSIFFLTFSDRTGGDPNGPLDISLNNGFFQPSFIRWVLEPAELAGLQINIGNPGALTDSFPNFTVTAINVEDPTDRQRSRQGPTQNGSLVSVSVNVPVPEPSTLLLTAIGLVGIGYRRRSWQDAN